MRNTSATVGALAAAAANNIGASQRTSGAFAMTLDGTLSTGYSATSIAAAQAVGGAGDLTLTSIVTNLGGRSITVVSAGNDSGITFTVKGIGPDGVSYLQEILTGSNTSRVSTRGLFTKVTAITASGAAAGEDIDIVATGSSVNIQATESDVNAITINASGAAGGINVDSGTSGVIVDTTGAISLDAAAASNLTVTGAFALDLISTLGKVTLQSGQSAADSVVISSLIGGIDILAAGAAAGEDIDIIATGSSVNISATESAADSITIVSTAGGIDILASGAAAGEDIDIVATGSSINIRATESATDAVVIESTAGGVQILASGAAAG